MPTSPLTVPPVGETGTPGRGDREAGTGSRRRGSSTGKGRERKEREKESSAGTRTCHSEWCRDRLTLSCNCHCKISWLAVGSGGRAEGGAANVIPCATGPLRGHARTLGQPWLQPDSVKGRGGIHRRLPRGRPVALGHSDEMPNPSCLLLPPDPPCFSLLQVQITLTYPNTPQECAGGASDAVKSRTSALEGLICCHLQQRALPGSSRQERQPGAAAPSPGSPSETAADLRSTGVHPSSRGQPPPDRAPSSVRMMCHSQIPPLPPSPASGSCREGQCPSLPSDIDAAEKEAHLQPLVTREHLDCNGDKWNSLPLLAS